MKVLYVSSVCSKKTISTIFSNSEVKIAQSMQKFSHLLLDGFVREGAKVTCLSTIPLESSVIKDLNIESTEIENGIEYKYTEKVANNYLKSIITFFSSFYLTMRWGYKNKKKDSVIIYDVLKVSICMGSLLASKLLNVKSVGLVTDLPDLMGGDKRNLFSQCANIVNNLYINNFNAYILLTEQMNELINLNKRPYIIMEGLVDLSMGTIDLRAKEYPRNIIYAGGIYEKYGVKDLIDAFMNIDDASVQLSIYGHGDLKDYIIKCSQQDRRIKYYGVVPNNEVVEAQLKATFLVNPRPTHEAFTKYSFPSKNMEYMVSGTSVLTTKLPGMPKEYYDYVYFIEEESVNGIEKKLRELIAVNENELNDFGLKAKKFVLDNKNNFIQSKRILDFIKT